MAKGLRNGLGLAALLLLVACGDSGGGGGPKEDGGEPSDGGGGDARPDGGRDTGTDLDAEPGDDAEPDGDAAPDNDAEPAGDGGGDPGFSCSGAGTDVTASTGGEVVSSDGKLRLVLAPGALASDATVHVCRVPTAQQPSAAQGDAPLSDVYFIDVGVAFEGTLIFAGVPLPAAGSDAGFEPVTLRHLAAADGTPANLSEVVLTLADSSRLSAHAEEGGYVYLRALDAQGQYSVALGKPKATYVTGEIIALGARVEATGTPAEERSVAVDAVGCDVETIEPTGVTQTNGTSADCNVLTTVVREGDDVDGTSPVLVKDKVIDVSDADATHPPPSFFCKFPGAGKASTRVRFLNGTDTELSVVRELAVTCTYSGDIVAAYDALVLSRSGANVVIGSDYQETGIISFVSATRLGTFATLGTDGISEPNPTQATLTPVTPIRAETAANSLQFTTVGADPDSYAQEYGSEDPFLGATGGVLSFEVGSGPTTRSCTAPSAADLGLTVGAPAGAGTVFTFNEGANLDAVLVVAGVSDATLGVQRWIRPGSLALNAGTRSTPLLTEAQRNALPSAGATLDVFAIGFFRAVWDEERAFWPGSGGRVVPLVCGTTLIARPVPTPGVLDP